jgi:hypothetical protein
MGNSSHAKQRKKAAELYAKPSEYKPACARQYGTDRKIEKYSPGSKCTGHGSED